MEQKPSFFAKYKFTLISLVILIAAIIPLIILSQNTHKTQSVTQTTQSMIPTATPIPMTVQNAQPTLDAADQKIQTSLNQADTDLQQINKIDTSDETTTGL